VETQGSLPSTNSENNSKPRAVIPTQNEPSANSENDSKPRATKEPSANEPRATKKPRAIFGSRAIMPGTIQRPRAMNSNGDAERIDPKRDLQITNSSNRQQSINSLRLGRILRPTFKVQENQLITDILQQSKDLRNRHALMVLMIQYTEDADLEEPKTLDKALSGPNRT
jgi:hypothetical protein